jgi:hypothetical protein
MSGQLILSALHELPETLDPVPEVGSNGRRTDTQSVGDLVAAHLFQDPQADHLVLPIG